MWCTLSGLHCSLKPDIPENLLENSTGRIVIYQKGNTESRQVLQFDMRKTAVSKEFEKKDFKNLLGRF